MIYEFTKNAFSFTEERARGFWRYLDGFGFNIGIAAGVAGSAVILSVAIAAIVAACNGLNSAQLAASHAVSGGTYEYGYRYLNPTLGFTAGWMFLLAKTASAGTAALGFAGYLLNAVNLSDRGLLIPVAISLVAILTFVVLSGIRRSNLVNIAIVSVALVSLGFFVAVSLPSVATKNLTPFFPESIAGVLHGSALMFVAYTGYGRIATMGEEARSPRTTIPQAMIITIALTMVLYLLVAIAAVGAVGAEALSTAASGQAAPLEVVVSILQVRGGSQILAVGAIFAMIGVLLNLILGLSRVFLAMSRRQDMPGILARLNSQATPDLAVIVTGCAIALIVLLGNNVKTTWSFSAFNVLIYYAITNLAALKIPTEERLYPKWLAWIGLLACGFLAFWVEWQIWLLGLVLILLGLGWQKFVRRVER
jgi:basic amino acid/polyamine antiporter, APA family